MKASRTPRSPSARRTSSGFGCEKAWSSRWRVAIAPPAAFGDAEPRAPADPAVAERVPLRRRGEERQRLVQALRVLKACPGDLAVARKTRREPASHRKAERVIERRVRDPGVVEALPRGGPEPHHALGEFRERAIDALEDLGTVGVRLEKAQRLVETDERRRPREGAALERVEQAELLLPRRGIVAGGAGGEVRELVLELPGQAT